MQKPKVLTIIGPTASGKTDFSYRISELLQKKTGKIIEIISADSRQVYKNIPVATAQPPAEYQKIYKHHFVNSLELSEVFNAGDFGVRARELIKTIFKNGNIPIVVGGSGLYLSSLIYGLFDIDEVLLEAGIGKQKQKDIRAELYERLEREGLSKLHEELEQVDKLTYDEMTNVTERRVIRALEVFKLTGIPISQLRKKKIDIEFDFTLLGLNWDRAVLYDRVNQRVESMIESGLIDEVKSLIAGGYHYTKYNSLNTVGIKEVYDHLENKTDYDRMVELIKQNTRHYAKRQLTWFRKDKNIKWIDANSEVEDFT